MKLTDLKQQFLQAIENTSVYQQVPNLPILPMGNHQHCIYTYKNIETLKEQISKLPPDRYDNEQDILERFTVRFTIDPQGEIWFGREGGIGKNVPAHTQMSNTCIAAGNIVFSQDHKSIIEISNKSGHFFPKADSLVWVIAALVDAKARLADTVKVVILSTTYQKIQATETSFSLSRTDLMDLLPNGAVTALKNKNIINASTSSEARDSSPVAKHRRIEINNTNSPVKRGGLLEDLFPTTPSSSSSIVPANYQFSTP